MVVSFVQTRGLARLGLKKKENLDGFISTKPEIVNFVKTIICLHLKSRKLSLKHFKNKNI